MFRGDCVGSEQSSITVTFSEAPGAHMV